MLPRHKKVKKKMCKYQDNSECPLVGNCVGGYTAVWLKVLGQVLANFGLMDNFWHGFDKSNKVNIQ